MASTIKVAEIFKLQDSSSVWLIACSYMCYHLFYKTVTIYITAVTDCTSVTYEQLDKDHR